MAEFNKVHVEGFVKRDAQALVPRSNVQFIDFCLVVQDPTNRKNGVFVDCFASGSVVEDELEGFVSAGESLAVDGFLTFRSYSDVHGKTHTGMVVYVEHAEEIEEDVD